MAHLGICVGAASTGTSVETASAIPVSPQTPTTHIYEVDLHIRVAGLRASGNGFLAISDEYTFLNTEGRHSEAETWNE